MDFISNMFDGFERDRLKKEKIIEDSKEELTYLRGKVDNKTVETDRQKQYSRIHGIPENNEKTDPLPI